MMELKKQHIDDHNSRFEPAHRRKFGQIAESIPNATEIIKKLVDFQIAIPSWALGAGGTRFGRFAIGGEPRCLEEKIADVGLLHALNRSSGAISLHIPWDIPRNPVEIKALAAHYGLHFDAVNSNTFQDQPGQKLSYKFGSLHHTDKAVRKEAIVHNIEVINYGVQLGSKALSLWLADGSNFPGQLNMRGAFERTLESLRQVYEFLPDDWQLFIEYKPYEPNFYSTTIGDWGQSYLLASKLGKRARTLVDLGHHIGNTNIEQIVALLLMEDKLGGFHFNDSKYGDDDLTAGCINPYQLFLIFNELVEAASLSYMIDASHNVKDPVEDLLQSVEAINIAYAQALLVDRQALRDAQAQNDSVQAQEILQRAYRTDVRPLVAEARLRAGGVFQPIALYRELSVREQLIKERGFKAVATGL